MDSAVDIQIPSAAATDLPPESVARIVAMCRSRRERVLADEEVHAQNIRLQDESATFLRQMILGLEEEEATMRTGLIKTEERGAVAIARQMEDSARVFEQQLEALRQRRNVERMVQLKKKRLQQELDHEKFRAFWKQHHADRPTSDVEEKDKMWNRLMPLVRRAYEYAAPPFATDPEELWCRGVVVPPDLQSSSSRVPRRAADVRTLTGSDEVSELLQNELKLPAYHDFGMKLRQQYSQFVHQHGSPEERLAGSPAAYTSAGGSGTPGSPAMAATGVARSPVPMQSSTPLRGGVTPGGKAVSVTGIHSSPFATFVRRPVPVNTALDF
jgi:hypothetical protein